MLSALSTSLHIHGPMTTAVNFKPRYDYHTDSVLPVRRVLDYHHKKTLLLSANALEFCYSDARAREM